MPRSTQGLSPHTFHIPAMGTGFMIDAPLRIARYGIASVVSLVDDVLIEQMRRFHALRAGEPYEEIPQNGEDARTERITAYLNLLDRLIGRQMAQLRESPFAPGSEITRYFELLPDSALSRDYHAMLATTDPAERLRRQAELRQRVVPGSIDVNIMAKVDRDVFRGGQKLAAGSSDASSALRGFARSNLRASVVFSAGLNPRLYGYAAELDAFLPENGAPPRKQIILKVSDYHSAAVQGRYLAKRGVWVSEYRVESGLNCGGHAFATQGLLLGPILEEFRTKRAELVESLHPVYAKAIRSRGLTPPDGPLPVRFTVQGGIGTAAEDRLMREFYGADGTGWGTPFLLVPEVTNVDDAHLRKLCDATEDDVYLSDSSPFGIPFWNLRNSASEEARRERIALGKPGSVCTKGYAKLSNTEFTDQPICTASRQYQQLKLAEIARSNLPEGQREAIREIVLAKSCICHDLAGGVTQKNGIDLSSTPAICCGPNIVNFTRVASLEEMVGHIYGRSSLLNGHPRPHMLLREIDLYLDYFRREIAREAKGLAAHPAGYLRGYLENLQRGIAHYRQHAAQLHLGDSRQFLEGLDRQDREINVLLSQVA